MRLCKKKGRVAKRVLFHNKSLFGPAFRTVPGALMGAIQDGKLIDKRIRNSYNENTINRHKLF